MSTSGGKRKAVEPNEYESQRNANVMRNRQLIEGLQSIAREVNTSQPPKSKKKVCIPMTMYSNLKCVFNSETLMQCSIYEMSI